jgi:hypothetical protein
MIMKKNVGNLDKWIRIILGVALLSLIFIISSGWRWIGLLGLVLIVTAFINFCPIYRIFGLSTKKK